MLHTVTCKLLHPSESQRLAMPVQSICLQNLSPFYLLMVKNDTALEINFFTIMIYETVSLKKDLMSKSISSTLQCIVKMWLVLHTVQWKNWCSKENFCSNHNSWNCTQSHLKLKKSSPHIPNNKMCCIAWSCKNFMINVVRIQWWQLSY